jgi:transcription elongation factor GreA
MAARPPCRDGLGMSHHTIPTQEFPSTIAGPPGGVLLSQADYDQIAQELESLRSAQRADLAERLREARDLGSASDPDDRMAVVEDTAIDRLRLAQLERFVASATVVDDPAAGPGAAGLGSRVRVQDDAGRIAEYELVGRRTTAGDPTQITPASPVGKALLGAQTGDTVGLTLPNGRKRALTVLGVSRS